MLDLLALIAVQASAAIGGSPPTTAASAAQRPAAASAAPTQVIKLGDGKLSCEALVAEVNELSSYANGQSRAMALRVVDSEYAADRSAGAFAGVAGIAAGLVPFGMGGAVSSAADHVADAAASAAHHKTMTTAVGAIPGIQATQQRIEHLEQLAIAKGC